MPSFTRVSLIVTLCVGRNLAAQPSFSPSMALLALPSELREEAAIMTYGEDGLFEVLRHGTNDWFCIADRPGDQRFSVECHPPAMRAYLERQSVLRNTVQRAERDSTVMEEMKTGALVLPNAVVSWNIQGTVNERSGVPDSVRIWNELRVPYATARETGLSIEDAGEDPWLMSEGRYSAHIMVRWRYVPWQEFIRSHKR